MMRRAHNRSELALERARNVLDPADVSRASAFWKVLTETAIRTAASGGDLDRAKLVGDVASLDSFRLRGLRRNWERARPWVKPPNSPQPIFAGALRA